MKFPEKLHNLYVDFTNILNSNVNWCKNFDYDSVMEGKNSKV